MRERQRTWWLIALLVVFVAAKGMVWLIVMPIGQQPDEPSHAVYAEHVALTGVIQRGLRPSTPEFAQMLSLAGFHDMVFRPLQKGRINVDELAARQDRLSALADQPVSFDDGYAGTAFGYPPMSYVAEAAVIRASGSDRPDSRYLWSRFSNVMIACLTAVLQLFVFLRVLKVQWQALAAVLSVQLMPMYSSMQAAINPDNLLGLWVAAFILLLLRVADTASLRWRDHAAIGGVLVAAVMTKQTAVALAPAYTVLCLAMAVQSRAVAWQWLVRLAAVGCAAGAAGAVWLLSPARPLPDGEQAQILASLPGVSLSMSSLFGYASFLHAEGMQRYVHLFWGGFGWVDVPVHTWVGVAGLGFMLFGLTAMLIRWSDDGPRLPVVLLLLVPFAWIAMLQLAEFQFVTGGKGGIVQGRYMFPAVTATAAVVWWGVQQAFRARPSVADAVFLLVPILMAVFHVFALIGLVIPRYYL